MIELKNIEVTFKEKDRQIQAVSGVNLSIASGDIFGIVGYSGAGKSTLVRVINLLQMPTAGSVRVDGKDLLTLSHSDLRQARKKIGMIFQHFNLMGSRTVADNVAFPLSGSSLSREEKLEKVDSLLDLVGILDKKAAYPAKLSGGQKQRVAIARALANDPKILLCDEATSALDPKTTAAVLDLLQEIRGKLGLTIVLITHEMQVVKAICNRVAVMEGGRVIEEGDVVSIFNDPKEALTRDFIRTATQLDTAENQVLIHNPGLDIYELLFRGEKFQEAVMIELYKRFNLSASILYGNIDYIQGQPLGSLLVTFDQSFLMGPVKAYLKAQGIDIRKLIDPSSAMAGADQTLDREV